MTSEQSSEADREGRPQPRAQGCHVCQPRQRVVAGPSRGVEPWGSACLQSGNCSYGWCPMGQCLGNRQNSPTHPPGLAYICEGLKEQRKGLVTLVLWNNQLTHTGMAFLGMTLVSWPAGGRGYAPVPTTTSPTARAQHRHLPPIACLSLACLQV